MRGKGGLLILAGLLASLALALALLLGASFDARLGPIRLRITDPLRPLALAAMFAAAGLWSRRFRVVSFVGLAVCGVLALAAYARAADPAFAPAGDIALIESYTIHASHGALFVGPYSRFGWNHPGPLYFYLLAPFYSMSEHRSSGLSAGALAINLTSLAVLIWVCVAQAERKLLGVLVAATAAAFAWRAESMLASQWNPHVLVLPTMAIVVVGAAVAAGRSALLPLLAGLASFVVQTHVGLAPAVAAVSVGAASIAVARLYRIGGGALVKTLWPVVNGTLWLLLLLWLLPIAEELSQPDGNLSRLWTFFALEPANGQPFRSAFRVWADTVSALVRNDVAVGWGTRVRIGSHPLNQSLAIVQTLAVAWVMVSAAVHRNVFRSALAGMLVLTSLIGLWSITRIEDDIYDHLVFWLAGVGALQVGLAVDELIRLTVRAAPVLPARAVALVCLALWALAAAAGFQQLRVTVSRSFRPGIEQLAARRLADVVVPELERSGVGRPLAKLDQPVWSIAAGVLLQLQKRGMPFAVEEGWWFMFGAPARPSGHETATLTFAGAEMRVRLQDEAGYRLITERDRVAIFVTPYPRDPTSRQ